MGQQQSCPFCYALISQPDQVVEHVFTCPHCLRQMSTLKWAIQAAPSKERIITDIACRPSPLSGRKSDVPRNDSNVIDPGKAGEIGNLDLAVGFVLAIALSYAGAVKPGYHTSVPLVPWVVLIVVIEMYQIRYRVDRRFGPRWWNTVWIYALIGIGIWFALTWLALNSWL